jgi:predicted DNA-binding transcriptional regulator YafY
VAIDADQAAVARSMVGSGPAVEERDDGSIVLTLPVTHRDGFRSFVLGFLDHAEVLEPPELRAEIVDWLTHVAADEGATA